MTMGCADVSEPLEEGEPRYEDNSQNPEVVQHSLENASDQEVSATCKQECGLEARGIVFADCMDDGGVREECGSSARIWYKECLFSRCQESPQE